MLPRWWPRRSPWPTPCPRGCNGRAMPRAVIEYFRGSLICRPIVRIEDVDSGVHEPGGVLTRAETQPYVSIVLAVGLTRHHGMDAVLPEGHYQWRNLHIDRGCVKAREFE